LGSLVICLFIILSLGLTLGSYIETSFGQTEPVNSKQTTLSGDLSKNPVAQDILKKIEQTKKWIEDLEKREYEKTRAQEELEEKRSIAIERLNKDLVEWENLWANYTSRAAFERFVEDKPPQIQDVFWDQFEFKEMKVKAGRDALKKVIADGGGLREARAAYHKAAETKRIELIEMNAQFNVKHNLAYYEQQILFNSTGQLPQNQYTKSKLNEYYTDYRSDPSYLLANPNDKYAYETLQTNPNTKCRDGYVVVHRLKSDDYACITKSTAQMWERYKIGTIVNSNLIIYDENSLTPNIPTNPATSCIEDYIVIYLSENEEYACVSESTAENWIEEDIAEIHELTEFILDKDKQKEIENQIYTISQEIDEIYDKHATNQIQLKKKYDQMYDDSDNSSKQEERELVEKYYSHEDMSKDELSIQIMKVRENNELRKEKILEDKEQALEDIDLELHKKMQEMASEVNSSTEIRMVWDSEDHSYHVEKR